MWKIDIERRDIQEFVDFILKYDELALAHPNQAAASSTFPGFPEHWISWSKSRHCGWNEIMKVYTNTSIEIINAQLSQGIPEDLCEFIRKARLLQLPRSPSFQPHLSPPKHVLGVTPKKLHEVFTMSTYIAHLFAERVPKPYIVDLGAGQGYLSRSLSSGPHNFHVLALDSSESQTTGSLSRQDWLSNPSEAETEERGSLTHRTVHVNDAKSLGETIDGWIRQIACRDEQPINSVPVVLVGLHCCGDLTPSALRFVHGASSEQQGGFEVVGCVIVGCCYNMCTSNAFPLSHNMHKAVASERTLKLETQHLHLATQSPLTWDLSLSSTSTSSASMAIKKVVYRALLSRRLPLSFLPEKGIPLISDVDWRQKRVGRLASSAYQDFPTFLRIATKKMGFDDSGYFPLSKERGKEDDSLDDRCRLSISLADMNEEEKDLSRILEVLYVLRCLLGPIVESIIALDRYFYLRETTEASMVNTNDSQVELVNLFDQSTGSLRNIALVWTKGNNVGADE